MNSTPLFVFLLLMLAKEVRPECRFPAIFNFGDSNSDTGGSFWPPYGMTYFKTPSGRASDGRVALDFIAAAFGYSYLSPYYQSSSSNYYRGVNFAVSGASVIPPSSSLISLGMSPYNLDVQLDRFQQFKSMATSSSGGSSTLPQASFFDDGLYILELGQNDIAYNIGSLGFEGVKSIFPQVADGIGNGIKVLYGHGARNMLVINVGPLGCYPNSLYYFGSSQKDGAGCITDINDGVSYLNSLIKSKVKEMQQKLSGASIIYVDSYSIKYDLISNSARNGFSQPLQACCGAGGYYNFDPNQMCSSSTSVCSSPYTRISWDGVHFTEGAHKHIATKILSGSYFSSGFQLC